MKSYLKLTAVFIGLTLIISSCSKNNNEGKMIPGTALAVVQFNIKSLSSKLSWNEIKQTSWYNELYNDTSMKPWTKKLMDNPDSTGIDLSAGLIFFLQKAGGSDGQIVFEGDIKDEKSFKTFNENLSEKTTSSKDGDINLLTIKNEAVVGWNDKKFAYVINGSGFTPKRYYDTDNSAGSDYGTQNLAGICKHLFALKTDSSMAKNDKFSKLLKEEGDIHVFQNTEEILNSSSLGAMGMLKLDAFFKGNVSTAVANFDNGKIKVSQKFYASPELTDVLKKYFAGSINTDMINNIPSQNVAGLLILHFKPEGLRELVKLTGMDGFINGSLSRQNTSLDDFVKANKGDIMFAVTDFIMKKDSVNMGDEADKANNFVYDKPTASFLFSASIGDKPTFNKLLDIAQKEGGDLIANAGIFFANDDKFFAVGNSQQYVSKYISGSHNKFDFANKLENHPVGLFIDIQKILATAALQPVKDSANKTMLDESIKMWQNIYSMGGEYKDDAFVFNSEINLVDQNSNSLKQLNSYFDKISKMMIEKSKKNKETWAEPDSTDAPPMGMDSVTVKP